MALLRHVAATSGALLFAIGAPAWAQAPSTPPGLSDPRVEIHLPLREGDLRVAGRIAGSAATKVTKVMVRVYSGWTTERSAGSEAAKIRAIVAAEGQSDAALADVLRCRLDEPVATIGPHSVADAAFDVKLPRRLNAGECVTVEDAADPTRAASAFVRSVMLDLGRMRGYFSIGGSASQSRSAFSQTDTFVSFTSDSRVLGWIVDTSCAGYDKGEAKSAVTKALERAAGNLANVDIEAERKKAIPAGCVEVAPYKVRGARRSLRMKTFRFQVNAFAEARVGFKLATTGAAPAAPAATGGQPAQAPAQRPDQLVFDGSQPGLVQLGLHTPMSFAGMDWRNDGKLYSYFAGPIFKFGAVGYDNPVVLSRVVDIDLAKAATDTARYTTKTEDLRRGAMPFNGAGVRFGIFAYELLGQDLRHRQIANNPVVYLDITWGTATGLRSYRFTRVRNDANTIETVTIDSAQRQRLSIEGRMKIPYLPALIGVDLNTRRSDGEEEPNDFRFVVAFRIDAQKALGRIFNNDALSQDR